MYLGGWDSSTFPRHDGLLVYLEMKVVFSFRVREVYVGGI